MQKKLLTLAVAVAVLALHMPAAEAVSLGGLSNIGRGRSYNRTTSTNNMINQAINKAVKQMGIRQ